MIYDCLTFFNELELLEIRLNELDPYVDKFVLVEATKTFTGKDKPLYYELNKDTDSLKRFKDKIIHIVVRDMPPGTDWERDHFQRDQIIRGLENCVNDDIILVSDADEIPNGEKIKAFAEKASGLPPEKWTRMEFIQSIYFFNCRPDPQRTNCCTSVSRFETVKKLGPHHLRSTSQEHPTSVISGWHLTWMGGADKILTKLTSWAHSESFNKPPMNERKYVEDFVKDPVLARDYLSNKKEGLKIVPIDNSFPKYFLQNQEKFKHLIWRKA